MACTFVGVKGDFWTKKSPIRLPKAHATLKENREIVIVNRILLTMYKSFTYMAS
jgi:hypothetical protein